MRLALIAAATLVATPALAQDPRPPAYTNAEACLRENAAAAVRAGNGAADAADFLLNYLCAGAVSAAATYERNSSALAAMQTMMEGYGMVGDEFAADAAADVSVELILPEGAEAADYGMDEGAAEDELNRPTMPDVNAMLDAISVDPVTGALVTEPGSYGGAMIGALSMQGGSLTGDTDGPPPIFLRELAGRLVLEQRR